MYKILKNKKYKTLMTVNNDWFYNIYWYILEIDWIIIQCKLNIIKSVNVKIKNVVLAVLV